MGIWTIISILFSAIKYLPQFIALIKDIIVLFQQLKAKKSIDTGALLSDLRGAVQAARGGDVKPLQDFHDNLKAQCDGIGCAPNLK